MRLPRTFLHNRALCVGGAGFTLIELITVLAITTTILSIGLFISLDAYRQYVFQAERTTLVSVLQKARSRALANMYQSPHGVCYREPNYIMFRGTNCVLGIAGNEEIPSNTSLAQSSIFLNSFPTIIFAQLSATTTPATVLLTDGVRQAVIHINYEGAISW